MKILQSLKSWYKNLISENQEPDADDLQLQNIGGHIIEQLEAVDKEKADRVEIHEIHESTPSGEKVEPGTDPAGNVTRAGAHFLQNLDAVELEYLGTGTGPGELIEDNVTKEDNDFLQNLAAVDHAFNGHGTGKMEMVTENVTDPNKSLMENLAAVSEAFLGIGDGTCQVNDQVVYDPEKGFLENLDAIEEMYLK